MTEKTDLHAVGSSRHLSGDRLLELVAGVGARLIAHNLHLQKKKENTDSKRAKGTHGR